LKPHVRNYMVYFNLGEQDEICCEICGKRGRFDRGGFDLHHIIYRSHGGSDNVENVILLCRDHHNKAHSGEIHAQVLTARHEMFMNENKTD